MNNALYWLIVITIVTLFLIALLYTKNPSSSVNLFQRENTLSQIDLYRTVVHVPDHNNIACQYKNNKQFYTCSGYCPLSETKRKKCTWLPRTIDQDMLNSKMHCQPQDDSCPTYNAFDKDKLPLTPEGIRHIPKDLLNNFTLSGQISLSYYYNYRGTELNASKLSAQWTAEMIDNLRKMARERKPIGSYSTETLYPVIDIYLDVAIKNKTTAVIGTEMPWIEAILLEYGAKSVQTIEYATIVSHVSNLKTITPQKYIDSRSLPNFELYDSIWCYSSLEHDGLGRYGDPLNPYGDMQTMVKLSCMPKPGGVLVLAMPTSHVDSLEFNLHRVYGPIRYPFIYRHFHLLKLFGRLSTNLGAYNQPILVMQNKIGCL
ncbi:unnamed protein product [Didymodactylos carnosus]|uniref:Uncharacterized protein n=1 Tax=Didymodactylos carnosus TaxID=1234261 RepID=A0A813XYY2_9BILA|nr:unnamed protein product [Didymodactylos carnosus]CAF0883107.1 unnamed protein product [Didymodactylos carnosus]CAF3662161.1 unnamed protein product [Didymodactylos carnosus]CAF3666554.1 unnamed protein product [Didymodactylos carnosus]